MRDRFAVLEPHRPWLAALGLAALAVGALSLLTSIFGETETDIVALRGEPVDGGVYFIGNSMFGTGLDIELARDLIPERQASLGYYDGHYSSMWYAAFRNALLPSGVSPRVVVWGFRPTYAFLPAFRQNRETELDRVHDPDDPVFQAVMQQTSDVGETLATAGRQDRSASAFLRRHVPGFADRTGISSALNAGLAQLTARAFAGGDLTAAEFASPDSSLKISDVIVAFATGGEIRRADALVIDNGERFVNGSRAPFDRSFIPPTVDLLRDARVPQFVVIFKPVSAFTGDMNPNAQTFYRDALAYFEAQGVPFIDFVADENLTRDLYARGDHYTNDGMRYVTERIVEALRSENLIE